MHRPSYFRHPLVRGVLLLLLSEGSDSSAFLASYFYAFHIYFLISNYRNPLQSNWIVVYIHCTNTAIPLVNSGRLKLTCGCQKLLNILTAKRGNRSQRSPRQWL